MHQLHGFLTNADRNDTPQKAWEGVCNEGYEAHLDENNWSEPIALVHSNGVLSPNKVSSWLETGVIPIRGYPKPRRFAETWRWCTWLAVQDMLYLMPDRGYEKVLWSRMTARARSLSNIGMEKLVWWYVPPRLARAYARFDPEVGSYSHWQRSRLAEIFERFVSANAHRPFASPASPYVYTMFDCSNEESRLAILLVDIHV